MLPILSWEDGSTSLTTRFSLVEPGVHAVLGQAGIERLHGVAVTVGMAEEDFEGAFIHKDEG
jgi:hypothetical protein